MANIESVIIIGTVRVKRGVNADQLAVLDTQRSGYANMTLEEADRGIRVLIDGELTTLVAWPAVRQIVYAPEETKPATPAAKGKAA